MLVADHLTHEEVERVISELESRDIDYVIERATCGCWTVISFLNPLSAMLYRAYGMYPQN